MSINQTLDNMSSGSSGSSSTAHASTASPKVASAAGSAANTASASPLLAGATMISQPQPVYTPTVDPNAFMNLYGNMATPAASSTSNSTLTGGR
jgi:hypothetical protein